MRIEELTDEATSCTRCRTTTRRTFLCGADASAMDGYMVPDHTGAPHHELLFEDSNPSIAAGDTEPLPSSDQRTCHGRDTSGNLVRRGRIHRGSDEAGVATASSGEELRPGCVNRGYPASVADAPPTAVVAGAAGGSGRPPPGAVLEGPRGWDPNVLVAEPVSVTRAASWRRRMVGRG